MVKISSLLNAIRTKTDKEYSTNKEDTIKSVQVLQMIATATLVGSVTAAITGFALTRSGGWAAVIGVPTLFVATPLTYLSFNVGKVLENIQDIIHNSYNYRQASGLKSAMNQIKVKKQLEKGTVCFDFANNFLTEALVKI